MKSFLHKVFLFALIVLSLCIGFELFLLTVSNEYSYKRKYVEKQGDKIKVLVMGHSHVGYAVIPESIGDNVFNIATKGSRHYHDAVLSERYVPTLKNLRCVIWSLGYNFQYSNILYPFENEKRDFTYVCMYEKYMGISYEQYLPYLHWSELINSHLEYSKRAFRQDFEKKNLCTPSGFERNSLLQRKIKWHITNLPSKIDYNHPNVPLAKHEGLSNMKRIANVCNKAEVRLVVITTPCYQTYLEQTTERGMKEMQECVDSMRSVYPEMEYYNFIDDPRFIEDDFFDSSHLNDIGAEKFSKILKDTLGL